MREVMLLTSAFGLFSCGLFVGVIVGWSRRGKRDAEILRSVHQRWMAVLYTANAPKASDRPS